MKVGQRLPGRDLEINQHRRQDTYPDNLFSQLISMPRPRSMTIDKGLPPAGATLPTAS